MKKFLYFDFYQYLFSDLEWCDGLYHRIKVIFCRAKGHPSGPVYYNFNGFEPDNSCKDCGDEI